MFPATSMPDKDWWETLWPNPEETMKSLGLSPSMIALDLCCGDGYFSVPLAKSVTKVFGLELDENLLSQAVLHASECNVVNCNWIKGDAMQTQQLIQESVDFIVIANTFHGIPNQLEFVNAVGSILNTGGTLAIINWHKREREATTVLGLPRGPKFELRMTPQDLNQVVLPCGYELSKTFDVSPYHYASVFIKNH